MAKCPTVVLNDGNVSPLLGLGTYVGFRLSDEKKNAVSDAVYTAIKTGYRHIDTAFIYVNEDKVGEAVKRAIDEGIVKREDLFIVTKIWMSNMRPEKLLQQTKESLKKLNLSYVDCMLLHFPIALVDKKPEPGQMMAVEMDNDVDIYTETWAAMEKIKADGLAKSIGISNFNSKQVEKLVSVCKVKPALNQVECHPLYNQEKLKKVCDKHGIVITAYSPFGGDPRKNSEGKRDDTQVKKSLWDNEVIKSIAAKYGKKVNHVLVRFQLQRGIIVIPKSVTKERIIDNFDVFDFELSKEDMASLYGLHRGESHFIAAIKGNPLFDAWKLSENYPFDEE